MKIVVSACLLGENCKYNGGNNYNEKVVEYVKEHEVIRVCPEQLGGLSTPRTPAEIVGGKVIDANGKSVNEQFIKGAEKALELAQKEKVDMAILQSRSPSCGSKQIYDGTFSGKLINGKGLFANKLLENGIPVMDVEDIK